MQSQSQHRRVYMYADVVSWDNSTTPRTCVAVDLIDTVAAAAAAPARARAYSCYSTITLMCGGVCMHICAMLLVVFIAPNVSPTYVCRTQHIPPVVRTTPTQ